jgi:hypothetical protein
VPDRNGDLLYHRGNAKPAAVHAVYWIFKPRITTTQLRAAPSPPLLGRHINSGYGLP